MEFWCVIKLDCTRDWTCGDALRYFGTVEEIESQIAGDTELFRRITDWSYCHYIPKVLPLLGLDGREYPELAESLNDELGELISDYRKSGKVRSFKSLRLVRALERVNREFKVR